MRPVNLIPAEERRGEGAPSRSGALPYLVVGTLVLVLAAVVAFVSFDRKIDDRKAEAAALEAEVEVTRSTADSLARFTAFEQVHDARVQTVTQLATSRFDWERVLRELSKVIPEHIWLTDLVGTVSQDVAVTGGSGASGLREQIEGPALELSGCGRSHSDVAALVSAMKDIDGVSRVLASDSSRSESGTGGGDEGSCQTRPSISQFHLIAAFDDLGVAAGSESVPVTPPAPTTESADAASSPTGGVTPAEQAGADGTPSDAQQGRIETGQKIVGAG